MGGRSWKSGLKRNLSLHLCDRMATAPFSRSRRGVQRVRWTKLRHLSSLMAPIPGLFSHCPPPAPIAPPLSTTFGGASPERSCHHVRRRMRRHTSSRHSRQLFSTSDMREDLLETGDKPLDEANPYDSVWDIGLKSDYPDILEPEIWPNTLLAYALQCVRQLLLRPTPERYATPSGVHARHPHPSLGYKHVTTACWNCGAPLH